MYVLFIMFIDIITNLSGSVSKIGYRDETKKKKTKLSLLSVMNSMDYYNFQKRTVQIYYFRGFRAELLFIHRNFHQ